MKKILMVCEALGGGVFAYVSQLCNDIVDTYEVYLAYSVRSQTPKNYKELIDSRVKLIEIKSFEKGIYNIYSDVKSILYLRKIYREISPDVIHLHSSIAGAIGRLAFWDVAERVVYTPHGYAFVLMGKNTLRGKLYYIVEKVLGLSKSTTLTCCESEDEVAKSISYRTSYVETGLNIADLASYLNRIETPKKEEFVVYTLGRICYQKQPKLFNKIAELVPNVKFVWVGDGELAHELTAPNILVTGWMPRKEAIALAKGADIYILCSLGEAIAMSLLENMFIKKLCLVSNTMGNKSVIKHGVNGFLCDTPESYAKCIKDVINAFPSEIPQKAYQDIVTKYNTDEMKRKYINFYNDFIKNNVK